MVESFWVIPEVANVRTPLGILREQAAALTEQTKGMLVGVVETQNSGHNIMIRLELSVPALNEYRYRILTYQQPIEIYPGYLDRGDGLPLDVDNEKSFIGLVKATLSSDRIQNILASLLAQVTTA